MSSTENNSTSLIILSVAALLLLAGVGTLVFRPASNPQPVAPLQTELSRKLIIYRELPPFTIAMKEVRGVAVSPDDAVWIAGDRMVARLDDKGAIVEKHPVNGEPTCLAVGEDGTLYVGLRDHVAIYQPDGTPGAKWASPGSKTCLTSITLGKNDIWVADAGHRVVRRYSRDGRALGKIPGFVVPSPYFDVAVKGDTVWVANPGRGRLESHAADGRLLRAWGEPLPTLEGFGGCCNPAHFALLPTGDFVTSEKGNARVKVYNANGVFLGLVADPDVLQPGPVGLDVAADSRGWIYLLDARSNTLHRYVKK